MFRDFQKTPQASRASLGAKRAKSGRGRPLTRLLPFLLVLIISFVVLSLPDHPGAFYWNSFLRLPLEMPLIILVLCLLPRKLAAASAFVIALTLFLLLFLKAADIGVQSAFQRQFNPYLDLKMLKDGWNLLSGTIGKGQGGLILVSLGITYLALFVVFLKAENRLINAEDGLKRAYVRLSLGLLAAGAGLLFVGPFPFARSDLQALPYLGKRLVLVRQSILDMQAFERQITSFDGVASKNNLFAEIKGRDVILVFVESYGRSAIEDPLYNPLIGPRLEKVESQLDDAGFASASGWLKSPTVGGVSWLAHGTFLSGLWVDNQARYDRLMISQRKSLNRLFQKAGWQTAAIMPAITMDWPEADYFGYDRVFAAKDLGYKGKPFNWITMPDQYSLAAFDRLVRQPARKEGNPVMAEMALVSSHAPWTPVARLIDWKSVGDGTVFNEQATSDQSPKVVWADRDNIRDHYIRTIDYSIQTLGDYVSRFGDDAIFIILGDHQPAPLITGEKASRAVPVHIISRDQTLVGRFEGEGFSRGMTPAKAAPVLPMDSMRKRLVRLFSQSE